MKPAILWHALADDKVRCEACAFGCVLASGAFGRCAVRQNLGGTLVSHTADALASVAVDPIEKKPLYHVLPGSRTLSLASVGCNFRCAFCQNHSLSQYPRQASPPFPGEPPDPDALVAAAHAAGCDTFAFTYSEPTIFIEMAEAIAARGLAAAPPLRSVWVTNGYLSRAATERLAPTLFAANIDLKGFREAGYREMIGASLAPVLDTIRVLHGLGVWLEITTLLIPGFNDSPAELADLAAFLVSVNPFMPWHLSAFHPDYRLLDRPPTPPVTLLAAREIGRTAGLKHIYLGNIPTHDGATTFCSHCGRVLIERRGYRLHSLALHDGACPACATPLAGRFAPSSPR